MPILWYPFLDTLFCLSKQALELLLLIIIIILIIIILQGFQLSTCSENSTLPAAFKLEFCLSLVVHFPRSSSLVPLRKSSLFFFRIFSKATWHHRTSFAAAVLCRFQWLAASSKYKFGNFLLYATVESKNRNNLSKSPETVGHAPSQPLQLVVKYYLQDSRRLDILLKLPWYDGSTGLPLDYSRWQPLEEGFYCTVTWAQLGIRTN